MNLQIYIDASSYSEIDLEGIVEPVLSDLEAWTENKSVYMVLNLREGETIEDWKLGLSLKLKSKFKLKEPLNFLYEIAARYKCEFVVAELDDKTGEAEPVCYFGYEEGRPDLFEMANYLGL